MSREYWSVTKSGLPTMHQMILGAIVYIDNISYIA